MNSVLLKMFVNILDAVIVEVLTPENMKRYGAQLFDFLEKVISDSSTKIDDVTLLPVLRTLRTAFGIAGHGE